jgi:hypothetical protein
MELTPTTAAARAHRLAEARANRAALALATASRLHAAQQARYAPLTAIRADLAQRRAQRA